jgi:hypothetical protein
MPPASAVKAASAAMVIPAMAPWVSFDSDDPVEADVVVALPMAAPTVVEALVVDCELDVVLDVDVLSGIHPLE